MNAETRSVRFRADRAGSTVSYFPGCVFVFITIIIGLVLLLVRSLMFRKKKIAALSVILMIFMFGAVAWAFYSYFDGINRTNEVRYGVHVDHFEGYFQLDGAGLDNESLGNITNTTFVFEVRLSDPEVVITIPLAYSNSNLSVDGNYRQQHGSYMMLRANRTIQARLLINSSDPDLGGLRLFGDGNRVNGSIMINGWRSMTFAPDRGYDDFSFESTEHCDYMLLFAGHFYFRLVQYSPPLA
jgi:hypothetical protein